MSVGQDQGGCREPLTPRQRALLILGAMLGLASGFGPVFIATVGLFLKPMALSFAWSRADISTVPILAMVGAGIASPFVGHIADRIGWRRVLAASIVFFSLGLVTMAAAQPSYPFLVAAGLLMGAAGVATTALGYQTVISLAFDTGLGMALGFSAVGIGAGAFFMPIVASELLLVMDWRQAYACLGAIALILGLASHQIIFRVLSFRESDWRVGSAAHARKAATQEGEGLSLGQAAAGYRFWVIGIICVVLACSAGGANIHLASYLTDRGVSLALAAQSAGMVGLGIAAARIGIGLLLDRFFAPLVAFGSHLLGAVGLYLITSDLLPPVWLFPMCAFLIGAAMGAEGDLLPFLGKKYFGVRAFGSIYGALHFFNSLGSILGTYVYGMAFDLSKSYLSILQWSAALCVVCSLAILSIGRYQYASRGIASLPPVPGEGAARGARGAGQAHV